MKNPKVKKSKKYSEAENVFIHDAARQYAELIVRSIDEKRLVEASRAGENKTRKNITE